MKNKIILVPLFFLLLISLVTQASAEETREPPYVSINFEVKSRDEILLEVEISRFVMPTFWSESKFVIGFFSPTEHGIKPRDVSAYCMENYARYSLFAHFVGWSIDNNEIVTAVCKFPSELENLSQISKVNLEITFSETTENSEFINGRKEDFPFDEYILNLYIVFLSPVGERHAAVLGDITFEPGLQLIYKINAENIKTPVDIKSSFSNADTEPVVYYTGFKFGTTRVTKFSFAWLFWPFYIIIIIGVLTSLLLETKKVALSLHIFLASFILLLTQHVQFMQIVPSEIQESFAHAITSSSSIMLMFSFISVVVVLCASRRRAHESLWEHLGLWSKLGIGVLLLAIFIGIPILFVCIRLNPLNLNFWTTFFFIPWGATLIFLGFLNLVSTK